jgi:hypothetical protein
MVWFHDWARSRGKWSRYRGTPRKDHSKEKRHSNAGRWMNPEYGYAKTNPNGKSLTASPVAMTVALAVWFPFTPG